MYQLLGLKPQPTGLGANTLPPEQPLLQTASVFNTTLQYDKCEIFTAPSLQISRL